MATDPNFPNRPDTPEFWRMSRSAIEIDERSETETIKDIAASLGIDLDAVTYMGSNRIMRGLPRGGKIELGTLLAIYLDAFTLGVRYTEEPGEEKYRFECVNEDGVVYDRFDTFHEAVKMLQEFPNDSVQVTLETLEP